MKREDKIACKIVAMYSRVLHDGIFEALNSRLRMWKPRVTITIKGHIDAKTKKAEWEVYDIDKRDKDVEISYVYIKDFIRGKYKGDRGLDLLETSAFKDFLGGGELDDFDRMQTWVEVKVLDDMSVYTKENEGLSWKDFKEVMSLPIMIRVGTDRLTFVVDSDNMIRGMIEDHMKRMGR